MSQPLTAPKALTSTVKGSLLLHEPPATLSLKNTYDPNEHNRVPPDIDETVGSTVIAQVIDAPQTE
jgi:hypothetical protein